MVEHENLWAPWRLAYVSGDAAKQPVEATEPLKLRPGADPECFICRAIADNRDRENLLVERLPQCVVMLNRYPYNNGHLLVAPLDHKGWTDELSDEQHLGLQQAITRFIGFLERLLAAEGFNVGLNLGRIAGAGLPGHLHWHIVPRWQGDTNFMPALAGIKVLPQALDALWETLNEATSQPDGPY